MDGQSELVVTAPERHTHGGDRIFRYLAGRIEILQGKLREQIGMQWRLTVREGEGS